MIRPLKIGLLCLFLSGCARGYQPVKPTPAPADVPDAALVAPCDQSEVDPMTNRELANELAHTRRQRDECAGRMDGVRQWRAKALERAKAPA